MTKHKPLPTLDRLDELFTYDPESGDLRWKVSYTNRVRVGDIAGCVCPRTGYRKIGINLTQYMVNRLVWMIHYGEDPGALEIDHINRNRLDNSIKNLRAVTHRENQQNRVMPNKFRKNITGKLYIRYRAHMKTNPWKVVVKEKYLGVFATYEEALSARDDYLKVGAIVEAKV
jgi:hypothetical protein